MTLKMVSKYFTSRSYFGIWFFNVWSSSRISILKEVLGLNYCQPPSLTHDCYFSSSHTLLAPLSLTTSQCSVCRSHCSTHSWMDAIISHKKPEKVQNNPINNKTFKNYIQHRFWLTRYIYIYMHRHVNMYVCAYTYIYMHRHVNMYVCVHIYIYCKTAYQFFLL